MIGFGLYVKNSAQAVEFYKEVFGLELGYHVKNPDGSYFHSELSRGGEAFLCVVEKQGADVKESLVQLGVTFDSEDEVRRAYDLLCEGGTVETPIGPLPWCPCSASVIDRFGVWWYVSAPGHRPPDDWDPDAPWDASMYKKP